MATKLTIESNDPDICGSWIKADVESEMKELDIVGEDWISYILSHYDFPESINIVLENDNVLTMAFRFNDEVVYVTKK